MRANEIYGKTRGGDKASMPKRALTALLVASCAVLSVNQPVAAHARVPSQLTRLRRTHGEIRLDGDGFNVMNVQLVLGSRLRFANPKNHPLEIRILTWRGRRVTDLLIPAHAHASWKPARYGVYDYFNVKTTEFGSVRVKGAGTAKVDQPVARKGSKSFPMPAYGVVAVTNAAGGGIAPSTSHGPLEVPGAGTAADVHPSSFMSRGPWIEVSGATMTFEPWVLVVRAGQRIHVYNEDAMAHSFYPGDYPVMYKDHQHVRLYRRVFDGFRLKMNGGHRSIVFRRPGIYHIVCFIHAIAWKHTYRPYRKYGGYPYVMDAVVVVEPSGTPA